VSDARPLAAASARLRQRPPPGFPGRPGRPRTRPDDNRAEAPNRGGTGTTRAHPPRAHSDAWRGRRGHRGSSDPCSDVARYLGLAAWTVRELEWRGVLPRVRVPQPGGGELRKLLFDRRDLDGLIDGWKRVAR
jgi:hypothetical protein